MGESINPSARLLTWMTCRSIVASHARQCQWRLGAHRMQSLSKAEAKIGNLASTLGPLEPSVSGSTACGRPDSYQKLL